METSSNLNLTSQKIGKIFEKSIVHLLQDDYLYIDGSITLGHSIMISGTIVLKNQFIDSQISHGWWLMKIGFEAPVDQPMVTIYGRVGLTGPSISPKGTWWQQQSRL